MKKLFLFILLLSQCVQAQVSTQKVVSTAQIRDAASPIVSSSSLTVSNFTANSLARFNATMQFTNNAGSGRIIVSDASGFFSWTNVTFGSGGGDVFTTSNNTFVAGTTLTNNGGMVVSNLIVRGIFANKTLIYPAVDGTSNQVMSTDGAGNLQFITSGGGGDALLAANQTWTGANLYFGASTNNGNVIVSNLVVRGTLTSAAAYTNVHNLFIETNTFSRLLVGTNATFQGAHRVNGLLYPSVDGTSNQVFTTDGVGNITLQTPTGASGVFTTSFTSADQVITQAGSLTLAHSLGGAPTLIQLRLKCTTAELGYSINDELITDEGAGDASGSYGVSLIPDAVNINIRYGSSGGVFFILRKDNGNGSIITTANWSLIVKAWR